MKDADADIQLSQAVDYGAEPIGAVPSQHESKLALDLSLCVAMAAAIAEAYSIRPVPRISWVDVVDGTFSFCIVPDSRTNSKMCGGVLDLLH